MRLKFALPAVLVVLLGTVVEAQNLNTPNKKGPLGTQVNTVTGNLFIPRTDIYLRGRGIDLVVEFYYNSFNHNIDEGFGLGWGFMYHIRYQDDTLPGRKIFTWGDGRQDHYDSLSPNSYLSPRGFYSRLEQYQAGKYRLIEKDSTTWYFDNAIHRKVTRVQEPNGNQLVFNYTDSLLTSIVNSAGQTITLTYNAAKRLNSVVDAVASPTRTYNYMYDDAGHLVEVRDPLGGKFRYTYLVNGPMKTAQDRNENKIDIIYFSNISVREVIGCNKRLSFSYDTATMKTLVTDHFDNGGSNQATTYTYKKLDNLSWIVSMKGNCCGFNMEYEYDDQGNVILMKDGNGHSGTFTYDENGNMLTAKDPLGNLHTYTYTHFGKVSSYKDPMGNLYAMTYDAKGNLVQLNVPGNGVFTANYNSQGDIISSTDPKGNTFNYSYDAIGNPLMVTGPEGHSAMLQYDPRGNLLSYTDAKGNTSSATYDILDRLRMVTDPVNQVAQVSYDANGNITSYRNENNEAYTYDYDASDRLVRDKDPKGNAHEYRYDAMNKVISAKNPIGAEVIMGYDNRSRLATISDPEGNATSVNYDGNGNITSISFPNGQTVQYSYDAGNRITSVKDNTGEVASFLYDANGNITRYTNATGAIISATYDSLNRVRNVMDPLGNSIALTYDKNDNVLSIRDREGRTRFYTYDSLNRPVTFTDNNGSVIHVSYDLAGNVSSLTDQNNNITSYTFDSLNRKKRTIYPNGDYSELTYDKKGNRIANRLTDGSVINYTYDTLNRMITKTLPGGEVFSFTYDANGRVIIAANSAGAVTFTYDKLGRVLTETFDNRTVQYEYNISGRTQTITYPGNTKITKEFDIRNRLSRILKDSAVVAEYEYNETGQLVKKTYANGVETYYQYDLANRLSSLSSGDGGTLNTTFSYDRENNKTAVIKNNNPELSETYSYDDGSRLTQYSRGIPSNTPVAQYAYTYDQAGNRLSADINGSATSYSVNNLNQLTGTSGSQNASFTYDARGNLLFDGTVHRIYDAEGRLKMDSISPAQVVHYMYDAFNRRVIKTVNGDTSKFTFSGATPVEERDQAGNLTRKTVFSGMLTPVIFNSNGEDRYYHQNELNSVQAITDGNGRVIETYHYDPYGTTYITDSAGNAITKSMVGNVYGFTGQVMDTMTGDYHFYYRHYSPERGVFSQRDLIGYKDGMALYQYVGDNPANGIDVWGLKEEDCPENEIIYITNKQFDLEVNKMRNELMKSHEKMISPFADAKSFDSRWHNEGERLFNDPGFDDRTQLYSFRGETYTGSELNYYFQGMFMGSFGYGESATNGIIKAWKSGAHGDHAPSPKIFEMAKLGAAETPYDLATGLMLGSRAWDPGDLYRSDEHTDYRDPHNLPPLPRDNELSGYHRYVLDKDGNIKVKFFDKKKMLQEQRRRRKLKIKCPPPGGTNKPRPPGRPSAMSPTEYRRSWDPNEIVGPAGQPDVKWVSVNDRMPYTIYCENDKAASAPAKYIYISTPIEPKQDISTFQLGSFGFNNQTFDIPSGHTSWYQRLDCRDSMNLYVDVVAGYDPVKSAIFWEFNSIDPVTLLPTEDPEAGLLFLQDTTQPNYGHGFVTFSIKPISDALTRDTIGARAKIVFDQNDTIPTNIYTNTIDAFPPTSHITSISGAGTSMLTLNWAGVDDAGGCEIDFYTIYVSKDQVNYSVLFPRITRTDTSFSLPPDSNYCFFVLATDRVGNAETLRQGEVQCAGIGGPLPVSWLYFTGKNEDKDNILKWGTASETDSKEFVLERSLDGLHFGDIATIPAAGNSSVPRDYQYLDSRIDKLNSSVMFYRVRQVDNNGSAKLSNIVKLYYASAGNGKTILYPNPGRGFVSLLTGNPALIGTEAIVCDVNGRILQRVKITAANQSFNLTSYVNGIYFIRLANGETMKYLKQ